MDHYLQILELEEAIAWMKVIHVIVTKGKLVPRIREGELIPRTMSPDDSRRDGPDSRGLDSSEPHISGSLWLVINDFRSIKVCPTISLCAARHWSRGSPLEPEPPAPQRRHGVGSYGAVLVALETYKIDEAYRKLTSTDFGGPKRH
ncbi:uncharacterized protein [Aegilops tauschii subsp. strangulata]|uniref:uncharacterized protein isoform X2 n=1 Tax=Aegilops tauschii subsp. strangulata TaxID=200361 RepID=UPI001E1CA2AC|nr:uncharacterized protein LOC109782374 isoform X2 [Aegilops tauschii subsp. strangulata]